MKQGFNNGASNVVYGEVEQKNFGLALGNKIFLILSDKLYADKVLAPIRELICNARDAHIAAGTENKKFIVHLPSCTEPWFSVRDFGTGLTHQEVIDLYTVYGMTTKDDSNKEIGCWGLGSKSPFAYTDRFEVYAYKDGTLNVYQCLMTDGAPTVTKFDTCKTKEPNGLEVKFDVKPDDFDDFRMRLRRMIFMQDYMDVVSPNPCVFQPIPERTGAVYKIVDKETYGSYFEDELSVEMGGVVYRVPHAYGRCPELDSFCSKIHWSRRAVIHADMGAVDITTSREQLDMTEKTYAFLRKAIKQFLDIIRGEVMSEVRKEKGILHKLLRYKQVSEDYGSFAYIFKLDKLYNRMANWIGDNFTISTIDPASIKVTRKYTLLQHVRSFSEEIADVLNGEYPIFVNCSGKMVLPPEVRRAAKALDSVIHCVRDAKTLKYLKRYGVPVHELDEYREYRPVRTGSSTQRAKKAKSEGTLMTSGLSTKDFNHTLADLCTSYNRGLTIYWCSADDTKADPVSSDALSKLAPDGLQAWYKSLPRILVILRDYSLNGRSVVATTNAAIRRAREDAQFVNAVDEINKFLKSPAEIKKAIDYFVLSTLSQEIEKYRNYGKDLCQLFYQHVVEQEGKGFIVPYTKRALLGDLISDKDKVTSVLAMQLVSRLFSDDCLVHVRSVESSIKKFVKDNLPLAYTFFRDQGTEAPCWDSYSPEVEEDIKNYFKAVVKRLRKAEKERKENNTNVNNNN